VEAEFKRRTDDMPPPMVAMEVDTVALRIAQTMVS
jgi:hypothetical protein